MTRAELAPTVESYFDLIDGADPARVIDVFTVDAVVVDDGRTYRGREAILGWLCGPASQFTTTSTRISAVQHDSTTDVVVLLEGDFPGGRVELRHHFTQEAGGLVSGLTIGVSG